MDYDCYQLTTRDKGKIVLISIIITLGIICLFYRSVFAGILFPFILFLVRKMVRKRGILHRREQIEKEFINGITVLNASLQAGLSMENAWREVEKELKLLFGEEALLYQELKEINQRVAHNVPIEKLFLEFAYRCKVEDVIQFAEILEYGKRSGSNWKRMIDATVNRISERYEAKQEIEVMIAEKKMEQQIMNLMPLGILAFLQFSAWDYMSVLYHNLFGVIAMTVFLFLYMVSIVLSQKIMKVEV